MPHRAQSTQRHRFPWVSPELWVQPPLNPHGVWPHGGHTEHTEGLCSPLRNSLLGQMDEFLSREHGLLPCSLHRKLEEEEAVGAIYCERLDDLLQRSDFVMLAVSLTPQTQGLIGKRELRLMKPTAILVNIGRGTRSSCMWAGGLCRRIPSPGHSLISSQPFPWMVLKIH